MGLSMYDLFFCNMIELRHTHTRKTKYTHEMVSTWQNKRSQWHPILPLTTLVPFANLTATNEYCQLIDFISPKNYVKTHTDNHTFCRCHKTMCIVICSHDMVLLTNIYIFYLSWRMGSIFLQIWPLYFSC